MIKILYIGNKLSKHGNTATSIETLGTFLEKESFKLYYASSIKNKSLRICHMILMTIFYSKKVNYVLIDTYSTSNFWYTVIISQLCRVFSLKYIPNLRGGDLPNRLKKNSFLCNIVFKNALVNIAPSSYLYNSFVDFGFNNVEYIPNTIELQNYKYEVKTFDFPKILWVRSFSNIYNPILAVKVLIKLKQKYPNAKLCMVGPKKDESFEQTTKFAEANDVNVIFTGKLSKEEWINLSFDYNVFLNTTHFDNTPVSVIEAMALGLPIVSTNVGGIPDLLENNKTALLVNDNDLDSMVFQIERLFDEKFLAQNLSENSRKQVENYDWSVVKNQWKMLLK